MGNRFIEALSGRYKHPSRAEQSEVACAANDEAELVDREDRTAKIPGEGNRAALAQAPSAAETGTAKESGQPSSWQLVLPGYEFTGGSLRAKAKPAPIESARNAANEAPRSDGDKRSELPLFGGRRSLVVGLSAGCLIASLSFYLGSVTAEREPSRATVMASTREPCPPPPAVAVSPVVSSSSLPLLLAAVPGAIAAPTDSLPPPEAVSVSSGPIVDVPSAELEAEAPAPVTWKAKPKAKTKTKAKTRIEMEVRNVMVSGRAVAAVIMLKRTGSKQGRTRVRWKTQPGTATPAKDYQGTSTTVQFADGQSQRTIFVPILQQPPGGESRTFSVVLERAPRGSPLGSVTSTTVTILGDG